LVAASVAIGAAVRAIPLMASELDAIKSRRSIEGIPFGESLNAHSMHALSADQK